MSEPGIMSAWRGYVNQLTYGVNLHSHVSSEIVARIADAVVEQRVFSHTVKDYYDAANAALASQERIAADDENEEVVRDLLLRLCGELDERRPWPEPAFRILDSTEWSFFKNAPVVGRIPLSRMAVAERVFAAFIPAPTEGGVSADILILQLRTGEKVALVAPKSFTEKGVTLLAPSEPEATVAAFEELTGLDVE